MTTSQTNGHQTNGQNGNGASRYVPRGASGIGVHDYVPELGYREYWYPAVEDKLIKRKPVALKLLGEQVAFFRDANDEVSAVSDICPHRGAFLSGGIGKGMGNDEFKGFITCPYHGYTFDGKGQCVAALSDGPDSKLAPKLTVRNYPNAHPPRRRLRLDGCHRTRALGRGLARGILPRRRGGPDLRQDLAYELVVDNGELPGLPQQQDSQGGHSALLERATVQPSVGVLGGHRHYRGGRQLYL